jgi:hypothetical protein
MIMRDELEMDGWMMMRVGMGKERRELACFVHDHDRAYLDNMQSESTMHSMMLPLCF